MYVQSSDIRMFFYSLCLIPLGLYSICKKYWGKVKNPPVLSLHFTLVVTNAPTAECYMSVVTTLRDVIFHSYIESVRSVSVKDLNKLLIFWILCAYRPITIFRAMVRMLVIAYYVQDTYGHSRYSGKRVQLAPHKYKAILAICCDLRYSLLVRQLRRIGK